MHAPPHTWSLFNYFEFVNIFLCWISHLPTHLLSKLIEYMSVFWSDNLLVLILYFFWNPLQLEDVFVFISLWYLSFSKYFALSVSVFGTAVWETDCNEIVGSVTSRHLWHPFSFVVWESDLSDFNILRINSSDIVRARNVSNLIPLRTSSPGHEFFFVLKLCLKHEHFGSYTHEALLRRGKSEAHNKSLI